MEKNFGSSFDQDGEADGEVIKKFTVFRVANDALTAYWSWKGVELASNVKYAQIFYIYEGQQVYSKSQRFTNTSVNSYRLVNLIPDKRYRVCIRVVKSDNKMDDHICQDVTTQFLPVPAIIGCLVAAFLALALIIILALLYQRVTKNHRGINRSATSKRSRMDSAFESQFDSVAFREETSFYEETTVMEASYNFGGANSVSECPNNANPPVSGSTLMVTPSTFPRTYSTGNRGIVDGTSCSPNNGSTTPTKLRTSRDPSPELSGLSLRPVVRAASSPGAHRHSSRKLAKVVDAEPEIASTEIPSETTPMSIKENASPSAQQPAEREEEETPTAKSTVPADVMETDIDVHNSTPSSVTNTPPNSRKKNSSATPVAVKVNNRYSSSSEADDVMIKANSDDSLTQQTAILTQLVETL